VSDRREPRTLLEQLVWKREQTYEEQVKAFLRLASELGEPATLTVRHLQRLAAGQRSADRANPSTRRVMRRMYGHTLDELLGPPAAALSDPAHDPAASSVIAQGVLPSHVDPELLDRLTDAEIAELAKLTGHVVDLELRCSIDIDANGDSSVTYRFEILNLTDRPVKRMSREQWFETTNGRLRIEPLNSGRHKVSIQRVHDTANMTKFVCTVSPAIQPGETGTIGYITRGGRFTHDHYWRQSTPRHTRRLTLEIRHRAVDILANCTAVEDHSDGSQEPVIDDLFCSQEDGDAVITLTREYLQPTDAVTIRWEVSRESAGPL
jgi:hypothetical protein